MRETSYFGSMKSILLYRFSERGKNGDYVILQRITEKEEQAIDENKLFELHYDGKTIIIPKEDICFYGEINCNNKDDIELIRKKNLVDNDLRHSWVPSGFNYKTGISNTKKQAPTNDPVKWFKYCHCRIGKPKRVIAYKIKEKLI